MTIYEQWKHAVGAHGSRTALGLVDGATWSYNELGHAVKSIQRRFVGAGLGRGDRVVLWGPNIPAWGAVYLAATTGAWVICPVLPDFTPAEAHNVVSHSGASLLVFGRTQMDAWKAFLNENPEKAAGLPPLWCLEDLVDELAREADGGADIVSPALEPPRSEDLAAIIYTSGTTGASKGVMLSHHNIAWNAVTAAPLSLLGPGDAMVSVLPLAHTYECTLGFLLPLFIGSQVWYLGKPPAPAHLLPALEKIRPHAMLTVPLFMEKIYRSKILPGLSKGAVGILAKVPGLSGLIYKAAGKKLMHTFGDRLRFFGIGGAALAPEVARFLKKSGFPYAIGYGLTETSPLLAGSLGGALYSTGPVLDGVEIRIAEPRNEAGAGEILARGPNVMMGYYRDEEKTREVIDDDGWFHTGDLGSFDRKGHLFIKGRIKNLILGPSGENIYPEAIEALINQDRLVLESLVLQRGKELVAKIVVNAETMQEQLGAWAKDRGAQFSQWQQDTSKAMEAYLNDLKAGINKQLARFSQIHKIEVEKVPFIKTATLKIKRFFYR